MADTIKTAIEIGSLAGQLTPSNQAYVLNTINALLYSQMNQIKPEIKEPEKLNKHTKSYN